MSNDMIAIKQSKVPAHLRAKGQQQNPFAAAMSGGGYPVVSIKGKVFHIQRGDERELVTNVDGDAAGSIEAVIVATNPNKSKVYYAHGYEEGTTAKPDCYSNDGIAPAKDAEDPQSKKCAVCPHNEWGSRITDSGSKGKACADSMRLAIAPVDQLNDPMLLRVPAASLKTLGAYGSQLAKRGVSPEYVVTKISFDHSVAYPSLTFRAMRFIDEAELAEMEAALTEEDETIKSITGVDGSTSTDGEAMADEVEDEEPVAKKPVKKKKKAKKPEPVEEDEYEDEDEEEEEKPVAKKPAAKKKKAKKPEPVEEDEGEDEEEGEGEDEDEETKSVDDYDDIDTALDNLDFDD